MRIGTSSKLNQFYFTFPFSDTNADICHDKQITLYKRTLNLNGSQRDHKPKASGPLFNIEK